MWFDAIHSEILSKCSEAFFLPLTYIFERTMETSGVPDSWKKAISLLFFRKVKTSNYRPVALT